MKKDCPAQVIVAAKRLTQQLEITSILLQHNHETSCEMYNSYPETCRRQDDEKQFVQPLLEMKVLPGLVVQKLNEKTGNYFLCSIMTASHSMIHITLTSTFAKTNMFEICPNVFQMHLCLFCIFKYIKIYTRTSL